MTYLPVDDVLPKIARAVADFHRVIVQAPPGSGKTTRVPVHLLETTEKGDIVVVEPRRLAARMAARHVAHCLNQQVGATVGYQVRFDTARSGDTRIRYVTEGVFTRQLLADPRLHDVSTVILDEFHERHLQGDLALGWLAHLQRSHRPDLNIAVMSATLDGAALADFLAPCPIIQAQGKRFNVFLSHDNTADDRALHLRVASAVRELTRQGLDGDVLVFLPGVREIRRAAKACANVASKNDLCLVTLHGNLTHEEQDRALAPRCRRKLILSTNVAESSVTIDGVVAVIDSGLARVAAHAPWSGLPVLRVSQVSKASAVQRMGRAGRTRPGRCIRLYSSANFARRPEHFAPEVQRLDLTESALLLRALGVKDPIDFPWFEAPAQASCTAADKLLHKLGAITSLGGLTPIGKRLLQFPVHPRVGRILVEAERRGLPKQGAAIAAIIAERDFAMASRTAINPHQRANAPIDLLDTLDLFEQASAANFHPGQLKAMGVDPRAAREVNKVKRHLASVCKSNRQPPADWEEQLRMCVVTGYPDRVARRVRDREVSLVGGGSAHVFPSQQEVPEFLVAVKAEEQRVGRSRRLVVHRFCQLEPEWLLDLFPEEIDESEERQWNAGRTCVECVKKLTYCGLTLDETQTKGDDSEATAKLLFHAAMAAGLHSFAPDGELDSLMCRVTYLREVCPEAGFPALDQSVAEDVLRKLCFGLCCLSELEQAGFIHALRGKLSHKQLRDLDRLVPEYVRLPGGRKLCIRYERGKPPWAASRLQDFFGMKDGPRIVNGRQPVVLHLLAPNKRAVQVTRDLAGFWATHYPQLRKQLCRRYPKHAWPEDGRKARAPAPGRLK